MATIHEDIEPWLAAAVHDQLSEEETTAFREHIAGCATCRTFYDEERAMSKMIDNTLSAVRPDLAFEQRVVSGFRKNVPTRTGFSTFFASLLRNRPTQLAAAAAVLLSLVQLGRMVTGEDARRLNPTLTLRRDLVVASPKKSDDRAAGFRDDRVSARSESVTAASPHLPVSKSVPEPRQSSPQSFAARGASGASAEAVDARPEDAVALAAPSEAQGEEYERDGPAQTAAPDSNRKLVRDAHVELEILKFDEAVQKIIAFAAEDRGYVATSSSQKQANGKLQGEVVVKVLPENLDQFLLRLRGLGELKNQTLGTDDVTKQYFDTDSRLKNARVMEQRLIDILKTKSNKVADLLEVEKELGRVRAQIEEMQGTLKFMDTQVQFATVTITLAEKDMNQPAAFLLKRRARLALFSADVEKTFAEVKSVIEGAKAQLSSSTLDRDSSGEATAQLVLLIVPEEADGLIDQIKKMGRVQNYTEQTDRVAQSGTGMASDARVERDKVELSVTISRNEEEPALQTTSLRILTSSVSEKIARLKENAAKSNAEIRSSSFSRDPDGQEMANLTLRVAMKNYPGLLNSFDQLGKVKDVTVQREDRRDIVDEQTAPADINIQVYSQPNIVSDEAGLIATIRHTLAQAAAALMWSLRMIGVALAFLAPWVLALAAIAWLVRRITRARGARRAKDDARE